MNQKLLAFFTLSFVFSLEAAAQSPRAVVEELRCTFADSKKKVSLMIHEKEWDDDETVRLVSVALNLKPRYKDLSGNLSVYRKGAENRPTINRRAALELGLSDEDLDQVRAFSATENLDAPIWEFHLTSIYKKEKEALTFRGAYGDYKGEFFLCSKEEQ